MTGLALYQIVDEYRDALNELADMDLDEQTLADTLEGLQGEVTVKGQNVAAFILNMEAEAAAVKEVEQRLAKKRRAMENRSKSLRDYLRMSLRYDGEDPLLALRIIRPEQHEEEMAEEFATLLQEQFGDKLPVTIGSFSA